MMLAHCHACQAEPPPASWRPVTVMGTK